MRAGRQKNPDGFSHLGERSAAMRKLRPVLDAALRLLAAVPLGYAAASAWAVALSYALPMDAADATIIGTLTALALCAVAAMWAYAVASGWRAVWTIGLFGAAALLIIEAAAP